MTGQVQSANVIVAVGSVDGMCGAAAYKRYSKNADIQIIFTQAFQVNTIKVDEWPEKSRVGLIDLGVNNEGPSPNPQMTIDFINRIRTVGHTVVFIADEHGKGAWQEVLSKCGLGIEQLLIKPENREGEYSSSCAILRKAFGESIDKHTADLLHAGDEADKMNFDTPLGRIFNECIKSNMGDPVRRPYVVQYMAWNDKPDAKIQGWMKEYQEIQENLPKILESGKDIGGGIFKYDSAGLRHDATAVFNAAYKKSPIVVLSGTDVFLKGKKQLGVSVATNRKDLDVLKVIQGAGITAGGMAQKANLALKDEEKAIEAVQKALL